MYGGAVVKLASSLHAWVDCSHVSGPWMRSLAFMDIRESAPHQTYGPLGPVGYTGSSDHDPTVAV